MGGGAWIGLIWLRIVTRQRAVVNAVMNFWVLQTAEKFLSSRGAVSFSRNFCYMELVETAATKI